MMFRLKNLEKLMIVFTGEQLHWMLWLFQNKDQNRFAVIREA